MTSHHAATGQGYGICGKLSRLRRATFQQIPQPRRRRLDEINNSVIKRSGARGTRLGKIYLLDRCLLMGGTETSASSMSSTAFWQRLPQPLTMVSRH